MTNLVPTLETCKELKDNGFKQEGRVFYWNHYVHSKNPMESKQDYWSLRNCIESSEYYAAPLSGELGEEFKELYIDNTEVQVVSYWSESENKWRCSSGKPMDEAPNEFVSKADTEAECRALYWLHLKKNGLMEV